MQGLKFGERQVFFDVDSIGPGQWRTQIDHALGQCRVALVLIGPRWAAISDAAGVTSVSLTLDYNPLLLSISGVSMTIG